MLNKASQNQRKAVIGLLHGIQLTFQLSYRLEALLQLHEVLLLFLGLQLAETAELFMQIMNV